MKVIIGTRGSDLALWQAYYTQSLLKKNGVESELQIIKTQGDKIQHLSFDKMEGKGFFTKEIEEHLLDNKVDVAVHSHKDLETTEPEGLTVVAVSDRENPSELILIRKDKVDKTQPLSVIKNGIIGTSSARRKSQITFFRPDLEIKDLRGNVPTRINKLRNGDYDAIMLANAGVSRLELNLDDLFTEVLDPTYFIPAPAQGVLAWQAKATNKAVNSVFAKLNNEQIEQVLAVERGVLKACNGGCQIPLGVYCKPTDNGFSVWVSYAQELGSPLKRFVLEGENPAELVAKCMEIINQQPEKKKF